MPHLDIWVEDLDAAGVHAVAVGSVVAEYQPQNGLRGYLDPAGCALCLFLRA